MIRIASSPRSLEHQADVYTFDVLEPAGFDVTYKQARCSCGWQGEPTYITRAAFADVEEHLDEAAPQPGIGSDSTGRGSQGGGAYWAGCVAGSLA